MKRTTALIAVALLAAAPMAQAQGNGHGKNKGNGHFVVQKHCPPGLAKKGNGCTPPGLARTQPTHDHRDTVVIYNTGERIPSGYIVVQDPAYYGLNPSYTYYRTGDNFYRVNRETNEVIAFVGALANLLD